MSGLGYHVKAAGFAGGILAFRNIWCDLGVQQAVHQKTNLQRKEGEPAKEFVWNTWRTG